MTGGGRATTGGWWLFFVRREHFHRRVAVAPSNMEMPPAKIILQAGANVRMQKSCIFAVFEVQAEWMAVWKNYFGPFVKMFFSSSGMKL